MTTLEHLYEPHPEREFTNILSPQEVGYIAAVKQNASKTAQNLAAIESGFFESVDHSWMEAEQNKLRSLAQLHSVRTKTSSKLGREALAECEKGLGLSKGAKVRHSEKHKHIKRFITRSRRLPPRHCTKTDYAPNFDQDIENHLQTPENCWKGGKYQSHGKSRAYLMKREWSNQIKMQMVYSPRPSDAPDVNVGERYTERLTARSVRKIFESGAYVASCHKGFTTFLTLTFDDIKRAHIFADKSGIHLTAEGNQFTPLSQDMAPYSPLPMTIGSEVSRFLDSAKRVYHRGFSYKEKDFNCLSLETNKVEGHFKPAPLFGRKTKTELVGPARTKADFHYIWVAECPVNEYGQPNPHIHILLRWNVEPHHFRPWAARLEKIWGHGFAKLERIKFSKGAAAYIIKAVGYAAKGGNADQGLIKGNRYGIARCSRAPAWDVLASFDADNMAAIIKECGYRLEKWRKPIEKEVARKNKKRDQAIKAMAAHRNDKTKVFNIQRLVKKLEAEIQENKGVLQSRGVYARSDNTFSICFEGNQAPERMDSFLMWAAGARNWTMNCGECDFTDLQERAVMTYESDYQAFLLKRADWQSQLHQHVPTFDDKAYEYMQSQAKEALEEYQNDNWQGQ